MRAKAAAAKMVMTPAATDFDPESPPEEVSGGDEVTGGGEVAGGEEGAGGGEAPTSSIL